MGGAIPSWHPRACPFGDRKCLGNQSPFIPSDVGLDLCPVFFILSLRRRQLYFLAPCTRESKPFSMQWIPDFKHWISDSWSMELGFRIPILSWLLNIISLSCILDSKAQDSGFHNSNFPGFPYFNRWRTAFIIYQEEFGNFCLQRRLLHSMHLL